MRNAFSRTYIHPTAIINKSAEIGMGSWIGPKVYIGPNVKIGPYCVIGGSPEHREFYTHGSKYSVTIEEGARISSFTTIDAGTKHDTLIGKNTVVHNHSHIAHDVILEEGSLVGGHASLAGHVVVMTKAVVSGGSCVLQWSVVGPVSFIAGKSFLTSNVPPGQSWCGSPARPTGNNEVGLSRAGLNYVECNQVYSEAYKNRCLNRG